ncbi:MAG: site-2 protease family protein [Phycisphaerales bacterium]
MRWSLKIGSVAGIGLYIHATFLLLLAFVTWMRWDDGLPAIILSNTLVLAVFACVVLHELGHALMARRFGIPTRDITLLPIGGVARLERMPTDPRQELLIALAGPAVNVAIAILLYALIFALGIPPADPAAAGARGGFLAAGFLHTLAYINVFLVLFNMLPAFPMDGGRVLRAALAYRLDHARATRIAAAVGQVMAALFFFAGLMYNPFLILIAVFVFMGAQAEAQMAEIRYTIGNVPVRDAMITDFAALPEDSTLGQAADLLLATSQQDFPVMDGERIAGILPRADLVRALASSGRDAPIAAAMRRDCGSVDASASLTRVFDRIQQTGCPLVPVTDRGRLVGLLTPENIGEFIMVRSALRGLPAPLHPAGDVREEVQHAG